MYTIQGADIDIRVVRDGRGPDCNIWSNFKQVIFFFFFFRFFLLTYDNLSPLSSIINIFFPLLLFSLL